MLLSYLMPLIPYNDLQGRANLVGGDRQFVPGLARAATAMGIYGLFLEVHPQPEKAKSDPATQLPLHLFPALIDEIVQVFNLTQNFVQWELE